MNGYQFLLEIDALNASKAPVTLRFCCTPGFNGGGGTWVPGIMNPGLYQADLFNSDKTYGASNYSFGEIQLANYKEFTDASGPLDDLATYTFNGRPVRMYVGPMTASFPSGFTRMYTANIETATVNWETVDMTLRGRQAELDVPLDGGTFLGNNTPGTIENPGLQGLEGVVTDLKDKPKPILIGRAFNFTPTLCNTARLIYAVSPLTGISADEFRSDIRVYDNGVPLIYAGTTTTIQTTIPPKSSFLVDKSGGYFRLGSTPVGQITCSAVQQGYGLVATPANLINYVLTRPTQDFSGMVDTDSFNAYRTADMNERGIFISANTNISTIIDTIMAPIGYWYFDTLGKMKLGKVVDPATLTPDFTAVVDVNISSFERSKSKNTKTGAPPKKIVLNYAKNYTIQTQPAGRVPAARRSWIAEQWRTKIIPNASTTDPIAETLTIDSGLTEEAFVTELNALYNTDREVISISILPDYFLTASALRPGGCVALDLKGRFGYSGTHMLIIGITTNCVEETVSLRLWG